MKQNAKTKWFMINIDKKSLELPTHTHTDQTMAFNQYAARITSFQCQKLAISSACHWVLFIANEKYGTLLEYVCYRGKLKMPSSWMISAAYLNNNVFSFRFIYIFCFYLKHIFYNQISVIYDFWTFLIDAFAEKRQISSHSFNIVWCVSPKELDCPWNRIRQYPVSKNQQICWNKHSK